MLQNNWSERTFKEINWAVPGKALQTLEHSARVFIIKFAHEHLPTRKHMMRIGEAETDQCPSCQHVVETPWHILSCPNRSIWRKSLTTSLDDILRITNTQPDLTIIMLQGVRGALLDSAYQMPLADREIRFHHLVAAQNAIGWNHLLKGRLSHHWLLCQQLHIHLDPNIDSNKTSSEHWLKRVLNCLWTSIWQVWLIRNEDLHGRDRQQRETKRIEKLTPQVVALYAQADLLLAADKDLFSIPLPVRLTFPSGELSTWIKLVTPTVKRAIHDAHEHIRLTNATMDAFLVPRPDPLTLNEQVNELRPVPRLSPP